MRLGCFQFDVRRGEVEANLAAAEAGVREAAAAGLALVVLPEMWPTSFVSDGNDAEWLAATGEAVARLATVSAELGLAVAGSAFAPGEPGERPRNRLHLLVDGEDRLAYDKVHLFSPTAENEGFSAGTAPPRTVEAAGACVSGVVCYDLRFSPLLAVPLRDGAEILVTPAQWPTGRADHWRALLQGRAVELQAVILGANRTGLDHVGRRRLELEFPGNSLVVGPDGVIRSEGRGEPGLVAADVDLGALRALRKSVPVRRDARPDLYQGWDWEAGAPPISRI